jgi:hypothetical protein
VLDTREKKGLFSFYLAVLFITIVIPKAGDKLGGIPLTVANLLLGVLLLCSLPLLLKPGKYPWADRLYLIYVLLVMIIPWVVFSPDLKTMAKVILPLFVPLFVYYWINPLTRTMINSRDRLYMLMRVFGVALIAVVAYGLIQKVFGHYQTIVPGITMSYTDAKTPLIFFEKKNLVGILGWPEEVYKVTSTYQNGNLFGATLVMLMFPMTSVFMWAKEKKDRLLFGAVTIMSFLIIPFTLARSALFGAMVGAGTLFLLQSTWRKRITIVLLVIFMFAVILSNTFMTKRMIVSFFDPSMNGRIERMQVVTQQVAQGTESKGATAAVKILGLGVSGGSQKVKDFFDYYTENIYFTLVTWIGFIGLILLLIVVGALMIRLFRLIWARPPDNLPNELACGIFAGLTAYLLHGAIDGGIAFPPTFVFFWFLVGLGYAVTEKEVMSPDDGENR